MRQENKLCKYTFHLLTYQTHDTNGQGAAPQTAAATAAVQDALLFTHLEIRKKK